MVDSTAIGPPAGSGVADILVRHGPEVVAAGGLTADQRRVLAAITACRTMALGGVVYSCVPCGQNLTVPMSCRDRHCPRCQRRAQADWLAQRAARVLPVPHYQVVFTLPGKLRPLARVNRAIVYGLLFDAARHVLLTLGRQRLDARIGVTAVLHSWGRDLTFHPHVHCVVSAGGLTMDDARWQRVGSTYLFPVAIMRRMFRVRFLEQLRVAWRDGELALPGGGTTGQPEHERAFAGLIGDVDRQKWVVFVEAPQDRPAPVMLKYLARYVYRVAIDDRRIVDVSAQAVTFRTRGDQTLTLEPGRFVRRFLQHVLPAGFRKVRHYGLYAPTNVQLRLHIARRLLEQPSPSSAEHNKVATHPDDPVDGDIDLRPPPACPCCGAGMVRMGVVVAYDPVGAVGWPRSRGPPADDRSAA